MQENEAHGIVNELLEFINKTPTQYHAAENIKTLLLKNSYTPLYESEQWDIKSGGKYFVTRGSSSLIAFEVPTAAPSCGFMICASHSDSPCFKIKPNPEMLINGEYIKLNTEKYGGMIYSSWLDRPLSVAGRVYVKKDNKLKPVLINIDKDMAIIPSLAIHLNHEANSGFKLTPQTDLLPIICGGGEASINRFKELIYEKVLSRDIYGCDLYLYNRQPACYTGLDDEFFSAPRIDNLGCAYLTLKAFLNSKSTSAIKVYALFDNEEVGSGTRQGAKSTFLHDTLLRCIDSLSLSYTDYLRLLSKSFMLSCDNGHALHPNHAEKSCPTNKPLLGGGVLLKYNAQQKYTTDAASEAVFRMICKTAGVPVQEYVNHSNLPGGSTLGNLSTEQVSICAADIGLPQLAMHSSYETAGCKDAMYLSKAVTKFYNSTITVHGDNEYEINSI